jgi:hypothetical protein
MREDKAFVVIHSDRKGFYASLALYLTMEYKTFFASVFHGNTYYVISEIRAIEKFRVACVQDIQKFRVQKLILSAGISFGVEVSQCHFYQVPEKTVNEAFPKAVIVKSFPLPDTLSVCSSVSCLCLMLGQKYSPAFNKFIITRFGSKHRLCPVSERASVYRPEIAGVEAALVVGSEPILAGRESVSRGT